MIYECVYIIKNSVCVYVCARVCMYRHVCVCVCVCMHKRGLEGYVLRRWEGRFVCVCVCTRVCARASICFHTVFKKKIK